ncbi:NAD(P)/FAD-dependent oxidoreductase [Dactylosporangium matsuzakiense]|uniref:Ferredoxin--NADP reductase n=1 Tax=Dactylosporangium matsuzakiense TaxID=53360 RepID=A0A9W6KFY1_9ACTN|nr:NAD(P)/FAD-dependent oxidoreductase [Dactylosporangium matsuzakiense]UWZ45775.1 NAD(P)/FAD-dependent oxidoreductase [Dactylosporangium matsuzakiense]GLK99969.1 ferredoxin--NADP reductase [Dactylosporangium matsuzakiense]
MSRAVDLAIVGAGPAGLFAAYYAGFRGLSTAVIDALPEPGGQVTALYPEKMIFDVAGFPAVRGRDLVANLVEQAAQFNPQYLLGVRAEALTYADERPVLTLSDGETLHCGAVLITGGLGSFTARPLPAAAGFTGEGLVFFVPHLADLAGHDVVIVGGGDSAFDWALALQPIARSVTLVHRRDRFRAHASTVARVQALPIDLVVNAEVTKLHGDRRVAGVDVAVRGCEPRTLPADTVVAALGFTADLGPLANWGLELDKRHIRVDSTTATNLPRVFAAGDISEYSGKVRLIAVGFGEAATAVNNAAIAIDPAAHLFPGHSSDSG